MICLEWEHKRQRAGPERFGQAVGHDVPDNVSMGCFDIGDMDDKRVEGRPAFGSVNSGDRSSGPGISTQPIDRFGWEGDKFALPQQLCREREIALACCQIAGG